MYKSCIVIVMCCAFFPRGSAAPKTLVADLRSQLRNDTLQEELDGQESILSKVGGKQTSPRVCSFCMIVFYGYCSVRKNVND